MLRNSTVAASSRDTIKSLSGSNPHYRRAKYKNMFVKDTGTSQINSQQKGNTIAKKNITSSTGKRRTVGHSSANPSKQPASGLRRGSHPSKANYLNRKEEKKYQEYVTEQQKGYEEVRDKRGKIPEQKRSKRDIRTSKSKGILLSSDRP